MLTALREYEAAVKAGNAVAQLELAKIYLNGRNVPRNLTRAYELFSLAAQLKHPEATYWLAVIQGNKQDGITPNPYYNLGQAVANLHVAARLGNTEAMSLLLNLYGGMDSPFIATTPETAALKNPTQGLKLAEQWANAGQTSGMLLLTEALDGKYGAPPDPTGRRAWLQRLAAVTPKDSDQARDVTTALLALAALQSAQPEGLPSAYASYFKAAQLGNTEAKYRCAKLIYDLQYGDLSGNIPARQAAPPISTAQAAQWLTEVMNEDDWFFSVKAATVLGLFLQGADRPQDAERAMLSGLNLRPYEAKDTAELQFALGELYVAEDSSLKRNPTRAYELFSAAADTGHAKANARMAYYYFLGDPELKNPHDYVRARQYAETASRRGNGVGTMMLALMYEYGWGVPKNLTLARDTFLNAIPAMHEDNWALSQDFVVVAEEQLEKVQKALTGR